MNIMRAAGIPVSKRGSAEYFTGTVWLDEIATGTAGSRVRALRVSFEPGARTAWHTHPFGQTLYILAGVGRVQRAGEPAVEVHPGDIVWFDPGERHWHGAAPHRTMSHLAIQLTAADGNSATWSERVSDADYNRLA